MESLNLSLAAHKPLSGVITLPGDKSLALRAALFSALAEGVSEIRNYPDTGVTQAMLTALGQLGVEWSLDKGTLTVKGRGLHGLSKPSKHLDCKNSATTIRMLAGALAASGTGGTLDGSPTLRKRPMARITEPLRLMGEWVATSTGCAPMTFPSRKPDTPLHAITYTMNIASAQVKSCLILAALAADGTTTITEPTPSRDHTERMLSAMGAKIRTLAPPTIQISPLDKPLSPLTIILPGDLSSAAFLIVAALLRPDSSIIIRNIGLNPTRTGLLDALRVMGAYIKIDNPRTLYGEPIGDLHIIASPLHGIHLQGPIVVRMIDEIPALAVAACFAKGKTTIHDAAELRYKETDRIANLCRELRNLGADIEEHSDGMTITGGTLKGGRCDACGDHRLAMSLAIAGLRAETPVIVNHAEVMIDSFPDFVQTLNALGINDYFHNKG
ncbi:MAG: 3-phosphoshikimate 1-carboxyvinyltransferase [Kiritimatiellae bacterium]|nr:3-phosphoshikimate 1-carboxyvinyltransferase [Kiritimatiellia bacterium]